MQYVLPMAHRDCELQYQVMLCEAQCAAVILGYAEPEGALAAAAGCVH